MKILYLPLKKEWYEMIERGDLRRNHPELWAELVELSHTPNLCSYGFKYGLTVQEVEKRMNAEEQQLKLF